MCGIATFCIPASIKHSLPFILVKAAPLSTVLSISRSCMLVTTLAFISSYPKYYYGESFPHQTPHHSIITVKPDKWIKVKWRGTLWHIYGLYGKIKFFGFRWNQVFFPKNAHLDWQTNPPQKWTIKVSSFIFLFVGLTVLSVFGGVCQYSK